MVDLSPGAEVCPRRFCASWCASRPAEKVRRVILGDSVVSVKSYSLIAYKITMVFRDYNVRVGMSQLLAITIQKGGRQTSQQLD